MLRSQILLGQPCKFNMGNKQSKTKDEPRISIDSKHKTKKQESPKMVIPKSINPDHAKFEKIDIVAYGKLFDKYQPDNPTASVEDDIRQFIADGKGHMLDRYKARAIETNFGDKQFPVWDVLNFCLIYNQTELMEFICTQELIETDLWCREYFKYSMRAVIKDATIMTKLSTINVMASYMVPERMSKEEINQIASNATYYRNLCQDMVFEGMNGRAQRIIQTRQALINNVDIDFPKELIGVVIGYAFGMFHNKKN